MEKYKSLLMRAKRLGIQIQANPYAQFFGLLALSEQIGKPDAHVIQILEEMLSSDEARQLVEPFRVPQAPMSGRAIIGRTDDGREVGINIAHGLNAVQHIGVFGSVATGKTGALAVLATALLGAADVVLIDSINTFSQVRMIRERFEHLRIRDLRDELFTPISGLNWNEQLLTTLRGLAESQDYFEFAELESLDAAKELHAQGRLTFMNLFAHLKGKSYPPGSNRGRYRDTAVLHYSWLLDGTSPLYECEEGMPLDRVLTCGAVCLFLDSLQDVHRAFVIRRLFDYVYMLQRARRALERPLVLVIDEAQLLIERAGIAAKLLSLRHSGVHLIVACQNPQRIPSEVFNNLDAFLVFSLTDQRDRQAISRAVNLNSEQEQQLPLLPRGKAIGFFPRSEVKHAFIVNMPWLEISNQKQFMETSRFFLELPWKACTKTDSSSEGPREPVRDKQTENFLRDVLNQKHEFSFLSERFVRCGIRSASRQAQIIKELISGGWIQVYALAIKQGSPVKLVEPTEKALESFGESWSRSRGVLPTRASTEFLYKKLSSFEGWSVVREGALRKDDGEIKQVDLLVRNSRNELMTVEVAHSSGHEMHNARFCLGCIDVVKHVIVCTTKKCLEEVARDLEGLLGGEEFLRGRLEVLTLAAALKDGWRP